MNRIGEYEHKFSKDGVEMPLHCHTVEFRTPQIIANAHYHEYMELLYCLDGEADCSIGGREYTFKKGDLVIINANEVHSIASHTTGCRYHVIKFMPKLLKIDDFSVIGTKYLLPFLENSQKRPRVICTKKEEWARDIKNLVEKAVSEWTLGQYGYELIIQSCIINLCASILRHWNASDPITLVDSTPPTRSLINSMDKIMKIAEKQFFDITAEKAAEMAGLSYSYFSRTFRRMVGMSFTSYIDTLKIKEGQRLLVTTEMSVTEIGQAVGFSTTSYFISRFRHHYGISPQKFRAFYARTE